MQNAATVLDVIRKRGERGLPVERLYRQLFNPQLYLLAYGRIYANKGAMTPGVTAETADGMSLEKIATIIGALRDERYQFSPARRVYIEKKGSRKKRPLDLPPWSDKLVAEVVRLLLEAYYDVQFSDRSHGFRPRRGCHTALTEVARTWRGVHWFIEGDIADCFGSLDHEVLLAILGEKIHDGRFLQLIGRMLAAGYLEDWRFHTTLSGSPQGGVASPILSNIYLDRLDRFVEQSLLPQYNLGTKRQPNPDYLTVQHAIAKARRHGDREAVRTLRRQQRSLPYGDPNDPGYRRLRYVRYCDDFLLGFAGPKHEAKDITSKIRTFLAEQLRLELSESKTLITHATSQAARFLGYEIRALHADTKITEGRRSINGTPGLFVPEQVIRNKIALYTKKGKPTSRGVLLHDEDFSIVAKYQGEYRGLVQYYLLAQNVHRLNKLHWTMETSLLKTLAHKHRSTVRKMSRKYRATVETPHGPRRCLQVTVERGEGKKPLVTRFGGIPLKRERTATLSDVRPVSAPDYNELIRRLLAECCELCEARTDLEVHHIRRLADLNQPGRPDKPAWIHLMARRKRKTLVLCRRCHVAVHAGRVSTPLRK
ncbi:MAG TPA: reverse transcriptase domain-containing protein [Streptomyces sp.]